MKNGGNLFLPNGLNYEVLWHTGSRRLAFDICADESLVAWIW
ncbi:hypothetical protein [Alkaliphilus serpentinus]|nr:hypothetical protein [Alkaliphilus serpentinus]